MNTITELNLLLNNYCNLRCSYCHFRETDPNRFVEMSPESLDKAIALFFEQIELQTRCRGVICFNADGEVMLSRELLVDGLRKAADWRNETQAEVILAVVTNATLIDESLARLLKDLDVSVTVSIDGPEAIQDRQRSAPDGMPTYEKVMRGIRLLKDNRIAYWLRAVVTPESVSDLVSTHRFLNALEPSSPVKLRLVRRPDGSFASEDLIARFTRYYIDCVNETLWNSESIESLPDDAYHVARFLVNGIVRQSYCDAGHSMLWLLPTGNFAACGLMTDTDSILGHIDNLHCGKQLSSLLDHPVAERLRALSPASSCIHCDWYAACRGGCPALVLLDKSHRERPPLCEFYSSIGNAVSAAIRPGKGLPKSDC